MPLCQPVIWSVAAMLRDSVVVVVVVVRPRPRAILLAVIAMRKSTHGFPFVSHIWDAYGAPLGGPSGRRSSAINLDFVVLSLIYFSARCFDLKDFNLKKRFEPLRKDNFCLPDQMSRMYVVYASKSHRSVLSIYFLE